jgi:hypothetical protein
VLDRRLGAAAGTVLVVATLVMAACGDDDDDTGSTLPQQSSTTVDEETAVLDDYRAGWQAYDVAGGDPADPDHPALAETMTGDALEATQNQLSELAERGEYFGGPSVDLAPEVTDLGDDEATVEDCLVDASIRYDAEGAEVSRADPEPWLYRATMVKEDGTWKRSAFVGVEACER